MDLDSERSNVLLLELSGQMALDEGGLGIVMSVPGPSSSSLPAVRRVQSFFHRTTHLSGTAIADKHKLEGRSLRHFAVVCGDVLRVSVCAVVSVRQVLRCEAVCRSRRYRSGVWLLVRGDRCQEVVGEAEVVFVFWKRLIIRRAGS